LNRLGAIDSVNVCPSVFTEKIDRVESTAASAFVIAGAASVGSPSVCKANVSRVAVVHKQLGLDLHVNALVLQVPHDADDGAVLPIVEAGMLNAGAERIGVRKVTTDQRLVDLDPLT
jgi:hypothetical protein